MSERWLWLAATAFALAVAFHNFDHLRRGGDSASTEVFWVGSAAILLEVGVVLVVYARHRVAPLAATVVGLSLAVGYLVVHFTPERSFFSDSFVGTSAEAVSIVAASLETVAALLLGIAGWLVLRDRGGLASAATRGEGDQLAVAARHPLVVAFALANVTIFVLALADR